MVGVLIPIVILGVLLLVALAAVVVVGRAWTGAVPSLSPRTLLAAYLYLVTLASIVIVSAGAGQILAAGFAGAFGKEFSYESWKQPDPPRVAPARVGVGEPTPEELERMRQEQEQQRLDKLENDHRDALAQGITAIVVGGLIGLVHAAAKRRLRRDDDMTRFLDRAEGIVALALFSLIGITFAVMAVYQLVRYLLFPQVGSVGATLAPGAPLGYAIAFVPVWLWRLRSFQRAADTT